MQINVKILALLLFLFYKKENFMYTNGKGLGKGVII